MTTPKKKTTAKRPEPKARAPRPRPAPATTEAIDAGPPDKAIFEALGEPKRKDRAR